MSAARYVVSIDDDVDAMSAAPLQAAALAWVASVFDNGGLSTMVRDHVQRLLRDVTANRLLAVGAWRLTDPDVAAQRQALGDILAAFGYRRGVGIDETIDAILELLA